jgi:hypothetical protein
MSEHVLDQQNQGSNQLPPQDAPVTYGLWGDSSSGVGVFGSSDQIAGVGGFSHSGVGIAGTSDTSIGVIGNSIGGNSFGVMGTGFNAGIAAFNRTPNNTNAAYLASGCCAAWFTGQVHVGGQLTKSGGGFQIQKGSSTLCIGFFYSSNG